MSSENSEPFVISATVELQRLIDEINDLKYRLEAAKTALPAKAIALFQKAPTRDDLDSLAWEVYWNFEQISTDALVTHYRMPLHHIRAIIGGYIADVSCRTCHEVFSETFTSRSAYRNALKDGSYQGYECKSCKDKRQAKNAAYWHESDKKREEEQRQVTALKAMPYGDYLQTDHWKTTRMSMLKRAGFRCQLCNAKGQLHVHHRTYENRGEEHYTDLIVLCADCHETFHDQLSLSE